MKNQPILALAGNDIFSGGGLHADLATYAAHQLHGFVAVTCLTALTEKGFEVFATDTKLFSHQLASLKDVPFAAIKIGLLPNVAIAEAALTFIQGYSNIPIVLDPVLVCKESHDTEVSALRDELIKFFPHVHLITPNLPEAQLLIQKEIKTIDEVKQAAKQLHEMGAKQVLIKGGNRLDQERAIDVYYDGQAFQLFEYPVLDKNNAGAGCTLASSIASQLALKQPMNEAIRLSKDFVYQAIQHADQYGVIQYEN